jgi:sensor domain CHASE-containing protein
MNLRKRTLLIIELTLASMILVLFAASQFILQSSFSELEEQSVNQNVGRALSSFNDELASLDTIAFDWAAWDDTYEFVEDGNEEYIESNLVDSTYPGIGLNLILIIDSEGKIVHGGDSIWMKKRECRFLRV